MAKFTIEQAAAVMAVQQLINEWATELDVANGLDRMGELITEDCVYRVGGAPKQGRDEVLQFYKDRHARLAAMPEGVPFHRHALSNLLTTFNSPSEVSISFTLIYFTVAGVTSGQNHADPAAVADVWMTCREDADGEWRIASFDSDQTFRRVAA